MKVIETNISGLLIIEPRVFEDNRGYFFESYNKKLLNKAGLDLEFVQDNQSLSSYGVIRGFHYQLSPYAQTKLVRVLLGKVLDVVVDIRQGSLTFGHSFSIELSSDNKKQMLIPQGFAHGFSVLSEQAVFAYKCDKYYNPDSESGFNPFDPDLAIDWQIPEEDRIVSEKDKLLAKFTDAEMNYYIQSE